MKTKTIHFIKEFSHTPGARYKTDGKYSGEEFREDFLLPIWNEFDKIIINLDGAVGYASGFLDEAFGSLVDIYTLSQCKEKLTFVCADEPGLPTEIWCYMNEHNN